MQTMHSLNTIDFSKLRLGKQFDQGAHSELYRATYKDQAVAVKFTRADNELTDRITKQFDAEVRSLSRLHHPNIVKFIAAWKEPPTFGVITEYLSQGSLRSYLLKNISPPLEKIIEMALDIARGMEYVHSKGIIHKDLKPENVLIDGDFLLKIADFGISCEEASCDQHTYGKGTYRWMAPELVEDKSYGRKVDVFSFGIMLSELLNGKLPYADLTPKQAAHAVAHQNLRPTIPEHCPAAMRVLIEQCWSSKPENRPEFREIVRVLEQFEASLALEGGLNNLMQTSHGILDWIHKHGVFRSHHRHHLSVDASEPESTGLLGFSGFHFHPVPV